MKYLTKLPFASSMCRRLILLSSLLCLVISLFVFSQTIHFSSSRLHPPSSKKHSSQLQSWTLPSLQPSSQPRKSSFLNSLIANFWSDLLRLLRKIYLNSKLLDKLFVSLLMFSSPLPSSHFLNFDFCVRTAHKSKLLKIVRATFLMSLPSLLPPFYLTLSLEINYRSIFNLKISLVHSLI